MATPSLSSILRFALFEVDLEAGEIRKSGVRLKLVGQPFQVLQLLLENPQEVVTREELRQRLWPDDRFVDYDLALKRIINRLREVLGDSAKNPRFVETIPRRGYRFIAPVNGAAVHASAAPASVTPDSIAVLPFINMSPDPENEFFADGTTEEIINVLSQIEGLRVAARTSSFFFKGKHIDMRRIGEQLNARTILEGSVRKVGDRLRITAQLVNVADGFHLWSERYDRELKDIFQVQDEIARAIAGRLKITFAGGRQQQLVKVGTENLEAYELYLKGRVLLPRRGPAAAYMDSFEQAVGLDPNYAQAWAGLADSYTVLGYSGFARPDTVMPKAIEAARRAVSLDPALAEAHNALAMASLMGAWNKVEAEREFLRALELNPRYIQARDWYAMFYLMFSQGRMAEAMAEAKLALEFDPLSSYAHTMYGFICGYGGEYGQAEEAARRAVELDSESYLARFALGEVLRINGKFEESVATGELALAISGRHAWAVMFLALALADWGKPAEAEALYVEMLARARRQYMPPGALAVVAAAATREDDAIHHACDAFKIRDPECLFCFSRHGLIATRLYGYRRFRELLSRS